RAQRHEARHRREKPGRAHAGQCPRGRGGAPQRSRDAVVLRQDRRCAAEARQAGCLRRRGVQRNPRRRARPVSDRPVRIGLGLVSAGGIALASYLTYVHYQPAALIGSIGGGCETVQHSKYATIVGIPVAIFGLAFWIAAFVLVLWDSELARTLVLALALIGVAFSIYLVVLQLVVIDATCTWCMLNDLVLAQLFLVLALARLWTSVEQPGSEA